MPLPLPEKTRKVFFNGLLDLVDTPLEYRTFACPASNPETEPFRELGRGICAVPGKRVDCIQGAGARRNRVTHKENTAESFMTSAIDAATFALLNHKRIYFGHQSVGANILDGVQDLCRAEPAHPLNIVESCDPGAYSGPVLGHSRIGRNHAPRSKIDAFSEILGAGLGNKADIALFKFCYVDVNEGSDVAALFGYYRNVMAQLTAAYPRTLLTHVTVPVTTMPGILSRLAGGLLRRHNRAAHDNLARAEYNRMLTDNYAGKEPVFDLAGIESTTPSGRVNRFSLRGREFRALVPGYSSDGRHLSGVGRRVVATAFLKYLALLGEKQPVNRVATAGS